MELEIKSLSEEKLFITTTYTDGIAGSLQVNQPVNFDGNWVVSRLPEYIGFTQLQTNRGPLTIQFGIPAGSLREAFDKWPEACKAAVQASIADIQSKNFRNALLTPGVKKS